MCVVAAIALKEISFKIIPRIFPKEISLGVASDGGDQAGTNGPQLSTEHHPQQAPPQHRDAIPATQQLLLGFLSHFIMDLLTVLETQQRVWLSFNTSIVQVGKLRKKQLL